MGGNVSFQKWDNSKNVIIFVHNYIVLLSITCKLPLKVALVASVTVQKPLTSIAVKNANLYEYNICGKIQIILIVLREKKENDCKLFVI